MGLSSNENASHGITFQGRRDVHSRINLETPTRRVSHAPPSTVSTGKVVSGPISFTARCPNTGTLRPFIHMPLQDCHFPLNRSPCPHPCIDFHFKFPIILTHPVFFPQCLQLTLVLTVFCVLFAFSNVPQLKSHIFSKCRLI